MLVKFRCHSLSFKKEVKMPNRPKQIYSNSSKSAKTTRHRFKRPGESPHDNTVVRPVVLFFSYQYSRNANYSSVPNTAPLTQNVVHAALYTFWAANSLSQLLTPLLSFALA